MSFSIGLVLFPNITQLDLTGPYEIFCRLPDTKVFLIAATAAPVRTEWGLTIVPSATFDDAPELDLLCVPGGWGVNAMLEDSDLLSFVRDRGEHARYLTSVCSGALLLGAAGLLKGYRATTHWASHDLLGSFGAIAVHERVVIDRNRITGAGVSAGIDLALVIAAELFDPATSQDIQLAIEYDPAPPFDGGSPEQAPLEIRTAFLRRSASALAERRAIIERVVAGSRTKPNELFR